MLIPIASTMADNNKDETLEITDKSYQKIAEKLEKSGYREGIMDGRDSIYQASFDSGYEDGFRIGFAMGMAQKEKSSRGNCNICADNTLLQRPELEVRDLNRRKFDATTET